MAVPSCLRLQDGLLGPDLSAILSPVASGDAGGSSAKNSEVGFVPVHLQDWTQ